jgi:hypothetical protein
MPEMVVLAVKKILHPECETGYKTQVGVECYEKNKENAMVFPTNVHWYYLPVNSKSNG